MIGIYSGLVTSEALLVPILKNTLVIIPVSTLSRCSSIVVHSDGYDDVHEDEDQVHRVGDEPAKVATPHQLLLVSHPALAGAGAGVQLPVLLQQPDDLDHEDDERHEQAIEEPDVEPLEVGRRGDRD